MRVRRQLGDAFGARVLAGRCLALGGLLAALGGLAACEPPTVQARAAWITAAENEPGSRTLWVYDRGDIEQTLLSPVGEGPIRADMAQDGRGLVLRGSDLDATYSRLAVYLDLFDSRRISFATPQPGPSGDPVRLLGQGDAAIWLDGGGLAMVPFAPGIARARDAEGLTLPIEAPDLHLASVGSDFVQVAADAPVAFGMIDQGDALSWGLAAFSYPRADQDEAQVELLASFTNGVEAEGVIVVSAPPFQERDTQCATPRNCFRRSVIFPDGSGMVYLTAQASCPLLRFEHRGPHISCRSLPEGLGGASLLAALDDQTLVFVDDQRLLLWRIGEGIEPFPVLGMAPYSFHTTERGRGMLFLAASGQAVGVRQDGFSILNTQATLCEVLDDPAVSPNGMFAAWACKPLVIGTAPDIDDIERADLVRVGPDGLERYAGVPVAVLAVDDDGNVLFHSEGQALTENESDADGIEPTSPPRNLLTLSPEGSVYRVDRLEPTPVGFQRFDGEGTYILSAPVHHK